VLRGEHLLAGSQAQPPVHEAEAHRGAVREGDLARVGAEVLGRGGARSELAVALVLLEVPVRILVEAPSVPLDRIGDGPGVGRQDERGEVQDVGRQRELVADRRPVTGIECGPARSVPAAAPIGSVVARTAGGCAP
jgi:hypothetical protein